MNNLVRAISEDGSVMACALNSTQIVSEIEKIHKTSAVTTAGLGRLATATSMMGYMLKSESDKLTLKINGEGPAGTLLCVANSSGNVKAYIQNPIVEIPLNSDGKLDVKGAIGTDGMLNVIRDLGLKEPYIGQVPIVSGEIAEDITNYYATSEQTPTVCGLGVLVNKDLSVKAAGGFLVQLLPFADEACIDTIEKNISNLKPVSTMYDEGMTSLEVVNLLLKDLNPSVLDESNVEYKCDCNRKRVERTLMSIGKKELIDMKNEQKECEVCCHFCNNKFLFNENELSELIEKLK